MGIQLDRVINENYEKLNTVDQHILQFVQANLESCKKMNIADLARHCSVSTATILRTAQKLNFSGYSEFKYFLRSDSAENAEVLNLIEILNQDISQTTKLFLQNSQVLDICRLIEQSSRIYAYGTGQGQRLMLQELALSCSISINPVRLIDEPADVQNLTVLEKKFGGLCNILIQNFNQVQNFCVFCRIGTQKIFELTVTTEIQFLGCAEDRCRGNVTKFGKISNVHFLAGL